jgi:hypothetical protein
MYVLVMNDEEKDELLSLLEQAADEHGDTVQSLIKDDSVDVVQFRKCVADENRRQVVRLRLRAMLKGGER